MYTQFYGLREKPFSLSPDPRYLYLADPHREALAHLLYGIEQGEGFICITGEVGTGKTTLCRTLLQRLESGTEVAFIFNPQLSGTELVQAINSELGLPIAGLDRRELMEQLNRLLLARRLENRRVLLIIDEAQVMERDALEQVRLLSNLETNTAKLIQIVLIGQPELDRLLESPDLRQLRQRISVRWRLEPLSAADTRDYVRHRLRIAAGAPRQLFTDLALREIHRRSHGIPRVINLLCDRALLAGYAAGAQAIGLGLVTQTDREVRVSPRSKPRRTGRGLAAALARLRRQVARIALSEGVRDGALPILGGVLLLALAVAGWLALDPLASARPSPGLPGVATPPPAEGGAAAETPRYGPFRAAAQGPAAPADPPAVGSPPPTAPGPAPVQGRGSEHGAALASDGGERAGSVAEAGPRIDDEAWIDLPPPDAVLAPDADLGTALARSSPAVTIARSLDVLLDRWQQPLASAELLSLPQLVSSLRVEGFSLLSLREARLETLETLDLPALLTLRAIDGAPRYATLTGLSPDRVVLEGVAPGALSVRREELLRFWQGEAYVPWRDYEGLPPVLRPGARGDAVAWLQRALLQLGVFREAPTSRYDEPTVAGVRALQRRLQLTVDGTVGPVTKIQLYRALPGYAVPGLVHVAEGGAS